MEAKTKKKLWIIVAVVVGIFVLAPSIPMIALFALDSSEKSSNQEIEQLISDRDFDKARQIAYKLDSRDKEKALTKINKAQLSVMVVEFSLKDAEYMAQELNAMPEFFEVLEHNIQGVYSKDFRGLYNLLTRYPISASFHSKYEKDDLREKDAYKYASDKSSLSGKDYYYSTNIGYNAEVSKFNNLVSQVIDLAIFDGNKEYLRKLLPLLKPEAVENGEKYRETDVWKTKHYDTLFKLENKAKTEALRKIKEAGINL